MSNCANAKMPSLQRLWEDYMPLREDADLQAVRTWTLPNSASQTDEPGVYSRVMEEDDKAFFDRTVAILKSISVGQTK